jgi:hypothetical protein
MRQIIFPHNDRDLTVALSVIGEQAHREAFRYDGCDGYSDAVTAFIRENGPEQSNRSEPAFLPLMHRSDVDSPVLLAGMVLSVAIDYGWRSGQCPLPECGTGGFRRCSLERETPSTHGEGMANRRCRCRRNAFPAAAATITSNPAVVSKSPPNG